MLSIKNNVIMYMFFLQDGRCSRPTDGAVTSTPKKRSRSNESPSLPHHLGAEDQSNMRSSPNSEMPEASYSTSEDEDFFDAEDNTLVEHNSVCLL